MAIFKHPDGSFRRYPPIAGATADKTAKVLPENDEAGWRQVEGSPPGVEIYRDGKTMRNRPRSTST